MELEIKETDRGFKRADFKDKYGSKCSIQESSIASEACIWLGVQEDFNGKESARMHLTIDQAGALIPLLQHFVSTGYLPDAKTK